MIGLAFLSYSMDEISTVSYIHWQGVPQGPGRGLRPRPGSLRYTPTVNVGKLFSHAPRMAQITAAVTAAAAAAVVSFRYFPPGRGNTGFEFSCSATPAEVPANPPWTVTIFLYADRHVTWENEDVWWVFSLFKSIGKLWAILSFATSRENLDCS